MKLGEIKQLNEGGMRDAWKALKARLSKMLKFDELKDKSSSELIDYLINNYNKENNYPFSKEKVKDQVRHLVKQHLKTQVA